MVPMLVLFTIGIGLMSLFAFWSTFPFPKILIPTLIGRNKCEQAGFKSPMIKISFYWYNKSPAKILSLIPFSRFRNRIVAALVQYLFIVVMCCQMRTIDGAPYSPTTGRRGYANANRRNNVINSMQCTQTKSYFFRSQCSDNGYMTVHRNRVLVQTTGLNDSHEQGKSQFLN